MLRICLVERLDGPRAAVENCSPWAQVGRNHHFSRTPDTNRWCALPSTCGWDAAEDRWWSAWATILGDEGRRHPYRPAILSAGGLVVGDLIQHENWSVGNGHHGVVASKETFSVSGCTGPRWSKPTCVNLNKQTMTKIGNSCQFTWASCFKTCQYPMSCSSSRDVLIARHQCPSVSWGPKEGRTKHGNRPASHRCASG